MRELVFGVLVALLTCAAFKQAEAENCASHLPPKPTAADFIACLKEQGAELEKRRTPRPTFATRCNYNGKTKQIDCRADCWDNEVVISGTCEITFGIARLQNSAKQGNAWWCLWNGEQDSQGETRAFCMQK
jgi:hypothetical protein